MEAFEDTSHLTQRVQFWMDEEITWQAHRRTDQVTMRATTNAVARDHLRRPVQVFFFDLP